MDAVELRQNLIEEVELRKQAEADQEEATRRISELLREVQKTDGITMVEAAEIVGVSRQQVHNMLRA